MLILNSCDFKTCDLEITNKTKTDYYFITQPINYKTLWNYNYAYKENISNDPKHKKRYIDFENNQFALPKNQSIKDCMTNSSYQEFTKKNNGLELILFNRNKLENKLATDQLTTDDIAVKYVYKYDELVDKDFKIEIE